MRRGGPLGAWVVAVCLAAAGVAHAAVYDWERYADIDTVEVISTDEDGGTRVGGH